MMNFLNKDWCMAEKMLMISTSMLLGMVLGFMMAPIKKGIFCGNYNGNTSPAEVKDI